MGALREDTASVVHSYAPGRLIVSFQQDVTEEAARKVIAELSPPSEVLLSLWFIHALVISCPAFDEREAKRRVQSLPSVRYAQTDDHVSLIVPGGYWRITRLYG